MPHGITFFSKGKCMQGRYVQGQVNGITLGDIQDCHYTGISEQADGIFLKQLKSLEK